MYRNDLRLFAKFNPRIGTEGLKIIISNLRKISVTLLATSLLTRLPVIVFGSEEGGMVI
jgi:hypothetical protein